MASFGKHCLALLAFLVVGTTVARAEDYRIGAQDKIQVRVVEWRGSQGTFQDWSPLAGEYTVSAQGTVAVPLAGVLQAEGTTTSDLAEAIASRLQERLGLTNKPDASVEITEYRPVFVLGSVEKPGPYPYQPGLTVLKALGLAGGYYRPQDAASLRLGRDVISADGDVQVLKPQLKRMVIRRARLKAELAGAATFELPPELKGEPDAAALFADEKLVMAQRAASQKSRLAALADMKTLFGNEAITLDQVSDITDRQIEISKNELKGVNSLIDKGLAVASRQTSVQRSVADLESKKLEAQTNAVRARQQVNKAEHDTVDAIQDFTAKTTGELLDIEDAIKQTSAKLDQARSLLEEATVTAPALMRQRQDPAQIKVTYAIVRKSQEQTSEITVDENAVVRPGDVVRIDMRLPQPGLPSPPATGALN